MTLTENAMPDPNLKDWTADELVAELRLRERSADAEKKRGGPSRAVPRPGTRSHELHHVPTADLAKLAQARQRAIYGVDNRLDLYWSRRMSSPLQDIASRARPTSPRSGSCSISGWKI
jgi:hypothetical protein